MKYFSLSYRLSAEDYREYDKIYNRDVLKLRMKRLALPIICVIIFNAFINIKSLPLTIALISSPIIVSFLISNNFLKCRNNSLIFKRELTVDFYDNHIVTRLLPGENFKSSSEKHYGFEKIVRILESDTNFYFFFRDNSLLIVPKRYVEAEQYEMIKNLIENLFRNKYFFLQMKN